MTPIMVGDLSENVTEFNSIYIGLKCILQPVLRSFYKSKTLGLNIQTPTTINWYKNKSRYDNAIVKVQILDSKHCSYQIIDNRSY